MELDNLVHYGSHSVSIMLFDLHFSPGRYR